MNKPSTTQVPTDDQPEVLEFIEAKEKLENWKKAYKGAYEELLEIMEGYNSSLENADKVVRAREISCGPFDLYQYATTFDANMLQQLVGQEDFLRLGGSVQTKQTFELDKKAFEAFVAQKKVHPDVVSKVVTHNPRYRKINKIEIP